MCVTRCSSVRVQSDALQPEQVYGELGDLAAGRLPGREQEGEITIADLTGVGVQDAAIAAVVVEALGL
jgi:ornithine cyclodeaminase